jgi:hypothetical protein
VAFTAAVINSSVNVIVIPHFPFSVVSVPSHHHDTKRKRPHGSGRGNNVETEWKRHGNGVGKSGRNDQKSRVKEAFVETAWKRHGNDVETGKIS